MGGLAWLEAQIRGQRGYLFGWLPVAYACGIGLFFTLRFEPSGALVALVGLAAFAIFLIGRWLPEGFGALTLFLTCLCLGLVVASLRTHAVAGPKLDWRYYGPVEGRIVAIDRSASDALRITLDQVVLDRMAPAETPKRVRVALHGPEDLGVVPTPGLRVMTTAHLAPPGGPVEPGGFDFQRHAWFLRLGAVGYARVPLVALAQEEGDWRLGIFRVRMAMSEAVRAVLPGDVGGFAAAVTTGDRSGLSQQAIEDMRAANTAHLLAISGLHMGLLSGFVLGLLRLVLAAVPYTALHWPTRKIAAGGALAAATGYLALSGGNIATERAFVMVAVMLVALMVDRRAISLRAVAIAALIVLTLRPEALMSPGFQMSFAATTALVAVFNGLRDRSITLGPKWVQPIVAVVLSSAVAGLATAPIGAAHFNTLAHYGLLANLLSVPLMGVLVVPAAVLAACLAPLGLEWIGLWLMGWGLRWILGVADWVASLDGARGFVPGPGPWVLPLLCLGALCVILWHGRARWAGAVAMVAALALWQQTPRPLALVADTGTLVGVMTDTGRALSKPKGAGFVAGVWLENDGDGSDQATAAARWPDASGRTKRIAAGGGDIALVHLSGKRAAAAFGQCGKGDVIVASVPWSGAGDCAVFDPERLRATGSLALMREGEALRWRSAREMSGDRRWSGWFSARYIDARTRAAWWRAVPGGRDGGPWRAARLLFGDQ